MGHTPIGVGRKVVDTARGGLERDIEVRECGVEGWERDVQGRDPDNT